jgi:hypothetical protein
VKVDDTVHHRRESVVDGRPDYDVTWAAMRLRKSAS